MPSTVAPDVQINPGLSIPTGLTVSAGRPLIVETNGRAVTASAPGAAAEYAPIDNYGNVVGASASLPAALAASGRWIIRHIGNTGQSTPVSFT